MSEEFNEAIRRAREEYDRLTEYHEYAPIFNSKIMLDNIERFIKSGIKPNDDQRNENDVGLLAAKALDFDEYFDNYALTLHGVWDVFLRLQGSSRTPPVRTDREFEAYEFYRKLRFENGKIWDHLKGIDFSKSTKVIILPQGEVVYQWRAKFIRQGNYYTNENGRLRCLGIYYVQGSYQKDKIAKRRRYKFTIKEDVEVLQSTAKNILDRFSVKCHKFLVSGGSTQYFSAKTNAFVSGP